MECPPKTPGVGAGPPVTKVVICPGDGSDTLTVTIDPTQFEALLEAINSIDVNVNFDGDAIPTPYCTEDGAAIYLCKITDADTGESTYQYHTVPAGSNTAVPYDGDLVRCMTGPIQLMPACFDGCHRGFVAVNTETMEPAGYTYHGPDGVVTENTPPEPDAFTWGHCETHRMCVRIWLPGADGEYFTCPGPEYTIELGEDGQPKKWWTAGGLVEAEDPTADMTIGTDYVLLPCDAQTIGEIPTEQTIVVPYDVNALPEVTDNIIDGSTTLENVCSLTVRPDIDLDCASGTPGATVTYTDAAGNTITETVHAGDERCYQCLGSDVTIDGAAIIYATTTQSIPIPPNEEC